MNRHAGSERNLTLVMDLYELTMAYNYFKQGNKDQLVYFDMFYRKNPDNGGFAVFAGLQQLIECIKNLHFSEGDIEYLRSLQKFDEDFLDYLSDFKFTGSIYAMKEGTPVFPNEPLITVKAKFIEAQIIETMLLVTVNHQSLIATKAHRVVQEAKGRPVMEFGARRAQGYDSATYGARAAYIGGVARTATVSAGEMFDIPVVGTMAHSFVQSFDIELVSTDEDAMFTNDITMQRESAMRYITNSMHTFFERTEFDNVYIANVNIFTDLCQFLRSIFDFDESYCKLYTEV